MKYNYCKLAFTLLCLVFATVSKAERISDTGITTTLSFSDTVKDYGPVIGSILKDMIKKGGGTLKINYGKYPILSNVSVDNRNIVPKIKITGVKNKAGKLPILFDQDSTKNPHHFFLFVGNAGNPSMNITISNFVILGNNPKYSKSHPFFDNVPGMQAISILNAKTATIDNVTIRDFYGSGVVIANYHDDQYNREKRGESPIIRNCKILNVWSWSKKMDSGAGIVFLSVNKPVVVNNTIINDLKETEFIGLGGIVLEHNTEKAIIQKNKIGGYASGVHAECDWGGHLIENNTFSQSSVAVTLSEDCNQPDRVKGQFSPIIIRKNVMNYNQEFVKYKIPRGNFSFVSVHRPNPMLDGLQVVDNTMNYKFDKTLDQSKMNPNIQKKDKSIYIELKGQSNAIVKGNKFN